DRLGEERQEHGLHGARAALGARGQPSAVLPNRLLARESRVTLCADVLVDRHRKGNVTPPHTGVKLTGRPFTPDCWYVTPARGRVRRRLGRRDGVRRGA